MDYLEFIVRVTSHIPDKGQVMIRYYGFTPMPTGGIFLRTSGGCFLWILREKSI